MVMEFVPIRMLSPVWARGRARVEDREIVLDEDRAERYGFATLEETEQMAFDLAALPYGDDKAAVGFVGRWGLLWHGADHLGSGACRESLEDCWVESGRLLFAAEMYMTIQEAKDKDSAKPIQDSIRRSGGIGFPSLSPWSKHFVDDYIDGASIILQGIINDGLNEGPNEEPGRKGGQRCWWGLQTVGAGKFRLEQYPPDLLSRAYSAFALVIANEVEVRPCKVCQRPFRPPTKRSWACKDHVNTYRSQRNRANPESSP
jgi:hypothetical protein